MTVAIFATCALIGIASGIYYLEQGQTLAAWAAMGFAAINIAELGAFLWRKMAGN